MHRLRQILGVKTLREFLVDFEISREADLPMQIDIKNASNLTNRFFYYNYIGGYYPCILK